MRKLFTKLFVLTSLFLLGTWSTSFAQTITSAPTGGLWSATTTWAGGVVPGTSNDVVITDGATVIIDAAVTVASITVGQGTSGTLIFNSTPHAVAVGDVTIATGGKFVTGLLTTGDITSGSTTIANVANTAGIIVGMTITGTGIPAAATVSAVDATTITLSAAATATTTGLSLTIGGAISTTNVLSIAGNITNNGTFDMSLNSSTMICNVTFTKAGDQNISGTTPVITRFRGVTLNKGAVGNRVVCSIDASKSGSAVFLLTVGTWEQTAGTLTFTSGNETIPATGSLIISGSGNFSDTGASLGSAAPYDLGNLTVNTTGTFVLGGGNNTLGINGGTLNLLAGTITIGGKIALAGGTTTIAGANITINQQGASTASVGNNAFDAQAGANLVFTSGTVSFGAPNAATDALRTGRELKIAAATIYTGNLTTGSPIITGVASTTGVVVGAGISGIGIPAFATVASFVTNTSITLNMNATATATGATITMGTKNLVGSTFIMGDGNTTPVSAGTGYYISATSVALDNLIIQSGGVTGRNSILQVNLAVNGTLTMKSGTVNLNGKTLTYGTSGTLAYAAASGLQTTTDSEFPSTGGPVNLTINNAAGVALHAARTIPGTLALTSGKLSLGANNLTIAATGSISGASAANYIVTDGIGKLTQTLGAASTSVFPIGASVNSYDLVSLTPTVASDIAVNVGTTLPAVAPSNYTYNAKVWDITPTTPSSTILTLTPSTALTTLVSDVIGHYVGSSYVNVVAIKSVNAYTATFSTFSPFVTGTTDIGTEISLPEIKGVSFDGKTIHNASNLTLQVFDTNGRRIASSVKNITMSSFAKGVYFVKSNSGSFKIVL